jgi:phospholipid transport system substrate-binding protein
MMNKLVHTFFISVFTLSLFGITQTANAQKSESGIKDLLQQRDQQIKTILGPEGTEYTQDQRQELKDVINGVIDYGAMAKFALKDTYGEISSDQQTEFVDLFSTIIRDHSLNQLDIYRADVSYRDISLDGNSATVETRATRKDIRKDVVYELEYEDANSEWVVTDFIIDDVSTADSYQRQFQNIIRKKGFDSLMETLRNRASR